MANVTFGNYTPLPPPKGTVDIRIGVFMDGTMNNRTNTDSRLGKKGEEGNKAYKEYKGNDSFENDWSNIARLETAYTENEKKYISKVYIEGIGTEDFNRDSSYFTKGAGGAFGSGTTGIIAKVIKGCEKVAEKAQELKKNQKVNCIYLDVFGFSRGAAAARNFVYEVTKNKYPAKNVWVDTDGDGLNDELQKRDNHDNKTELKELPRYGHLGLKLTEAGIDVIKTMVKVEFVGLFDTVSSYDPSTIGAFKNFENDVEELNLNAISIAKKVFHLVASDEHRVNFMLTKVTAAKGEEYILPGVHSDIGGSYLHDTPDNVQLLDFDNTWGDGYSDEEWDKVLNNDLDNLISQGWFIEKEVKRPNTWHETYGNRPYISNKYSFIPLHIMAENVMKFQEGIISLARLGEKKYVIPNGKEDKKYSLDLTAVKKRLNEYIDGKKPKMWYCTNKELEYYRKQMNKGKMTTEKFNLLVDDHNMLLQLRRKYFHWSAKYGEVGLQPNFEFKDKFNIRRFRKTDKYS
ncbi:DUF2235 domain-containing protein [Chryseobacterium sp. Ch-15]|uniref:DUF2235 domain-containing protein n=1 Tax=Chryseobacterium muglaense TaxID=2893752 RepID=A0A9Q3US42_9FLAO|nr:MULTISPECIES: DUF2235 domain-containing protein [Chryseobacterium]MBD3903470.1 DUF2235 domain-containing protein [Chryseobacterium muglaense]MBO6185870.1 DUF2235 domain-containing protein [Chryseobacterium sp.]MCC9034543.1 DUF2235 domain-containing protein [Chryseobacterium muglaense]MCM2552805.1 DUF2235 domain-containing protein [Chryseobacterium muglaense]